MAKVKVQKRRVLVELIVEAPIDAWREDKHLFSNDGKDLAYIILDGSGYPYPLDVAISSKLIGQDIVSEREIDSER
jgi:hypothetical protein